MEVTKAAASDEPWATGESFVTCADKIATGHIYRGGGTHKPLQAVEYILLGTLVTNIFPQDQICVQSTSHVTSHIFTQIT